MQFTPLLIIKQKFRGDSQRIPHHAVWAVWERMCMCMWVVQVNAAYTYMTLLFNVSMCVFVCIGVYLGVA